MPHAPEMHSEVRALAYRLAAGRLSWADYREQRAAAVAAIVSGERPLAYGPAEVFGDATLPKEHELSQALIDLDELEGRSPKRWPAAVAVGVLVVAVGVAGWTIWRSLQPPVVASAPVTRMAPAEGVLDRFLAANEWSAEALEETAAEWQALTVEERADARRSSSWRRVQHQMRERLNRQQVLASVDQTGEADAQIARLEAFGQALDADR